MSIHTPSGNKEPLTLTTVESLWAKAVSSKNPQDIKAYLMRLDDFLSHLSFSSSFVGNSDAGDTAGALSDKITPLICDADGNALEQPPVPIDEIEKLGLSPERMKQFFSYDVDMVAQVSSMVAKGIMKSVEESEIKH